MQRIKTFAALAAVAVLFAGCSRDDTRSAAPPQRRLTDLELASSLRRFDSCDALRAWAREELAPRVGAYGFSGGYYPGGPVPAMAAAEDMAPASGGDASGGSSGATEPSRAAAASPDFSSTNVQVEGVDEPDIVKTDGKRIVSVVDGKLRLGVGRDLGGPRHALAARRHVRRAAPLRRRPHPRRRHDRDTHEWGGKTSPATRLPPRRRTCPVHASCRSTSRVITSR